MRRGWIVALLGIVLYAFSLRTAVASFSPLIDHVRADFPLPAVLVGMIGTAPLVCFAVFGMLTPVIERRVGLNRLAAAVMAACSVGLLARGLAIDGVTLLLANLVVFAAVGVANVLIPALVKAHFPNRIGLMTAVYSTQMAVSATLPAALAVPIADAVNWRFSIGFWAVFAAAAIAPWVILAMRGHRPDDAELLPAPVNGRVFDRLWRMPLAWALTVTFATAGGVAYATFAWLPEILADLVGLPPAGGGAMLALFTLVAAATALLAPVLVARFNLTLPLALLSLACGFVAVAGLMWAPVWNTWLWVVLLNLSTTTFPITMVLLGLRTRTAETAVALSGFVQSLGYLIGAIFPLVFGILHEWEDGLA